MLFFFFWLSAIYVGFSFELYVDLIKRSSLYYAFALLSRILLHFCVDDMFDVTFYGAKLLVVQEETRCIYFVFAESITPSLKMMLF